MGRFCFKLYVAGASPRSARARSNLERIVKDHLDGEAEVEIIDLLERPHLAREDQVVAIPTLIRLDPAPRTVIVGDLSDAKEVIAKLGRG